MFLTFQDADTVVDVRRFFERLDKEAEVNKAEADDNADHHFAVQLLK